MGTSWTLDVQSGYYAEVEEHFCDKNNNFEDMFSKETVAFFSEKNSSPEISENKGRSSGGRNANIAKFIRNWLKEKNLTEDDFAKLTNISIKNIKNILASRATISPTRLKFFASIVGNGLLAFEYKVYDKSFLIENKKFIDIVADYQKKNGVSNQDMARRLGLSTFVFYQIRNGFRGIEPSLANKIIKLKGV